MNFTSFALWRILWKYSRLNLPKVILWAIFIHGASSNLLFWNLLGPMNELEKEKFQNHIISNFMIGTAISLNGLGFTAIMCITCLIHCLISNFGECSNPYPSI